MTPEGKVKDATKKLLASEGVVPASRAAGLRAGSGWYYMPVSIGMGVHGIPDILGHYYGRFFVIETKIPGKNPTALQQHQLDAITITGALAFVVRCEADLEEVRSWFRRVDDEISASASAAAVRPQGPSP